MNPKLSIAYFVTSHGFGHAARASAVMNAIHVRWPFVHFEIFTNTPEWFFNNSLLMSFNYHAETTDIGLVQTSALHCDLDKTIDALENFLPFDEILLAGLADKMIASGCHLVISDISPLGIAAAAKAGLSSILVENFGSFPFHVGSRYNYFIDRYGFSTLKLRSPVRRNTTILKFRNVLNPLALALAA
jgi:hypothetical protein